MRLVRQRRAAGGDDDGGGTPAARDLQRVEQVAAAARVRDDDHAVARLEHGRGHDLHMRVVVGDRVHAEAEELVLGVVRDDAGVAHAVELDAALVARGLRQRVDRALEGVRRGVVAVLQQRADRVVDDLDDQIGRLVVLVDRAVHEGHALVDRAGQLELEVGQAVVADAAAEAHHRRLADMGALGQLGHRQAGEAARVGQHQLAHALLGRRQRRQRGADAVEHRRQRVHAAADR